MQLTAYLGFDGQCAEAFRFYEKVLGGRIEMLLTHGESPIRDQVGPEWHDRVMHVSLAVGEARIMGGDAPPGQYKPPQAMCVSVHQPGVESSKRVFDGLAEGGTVTMPWQATFWSKGFGMLVDKYGIPWIVNCSEQPS